MQRANAKEFLKQENIQTLKSIQEGQQPDVDDDPTSHGTICASKETGQLFGLAKEATLVSVKSRTLFTDIIMGMGHALCHIESHGRQHTSVITISKGGTPPGRWTRDQALATAPGQMVKAVLDQLHGLGVPVVVASGNLAPARSKIDTLPGVLGGPGTPLINVGGAQNDGSRSMHSLGEGEISVYAPGSAEVQSKEDGNSTLVHGTSIGESAVSSLRVLLGTG
jgi:hypothetical protein